MTTHADTARATRQALAALWLPTPSIVALAERAEAAGCLDPESSAWLLRVKRARTVEKLTEAIKAVTP